ncbi:MAG TPA: SLBB domain-containing protein, partial [Candidatus Caenarcaniphilales bacterium]
GREQLINVNLREFLQTGDLSRDIALRDGDTVFVPTAATQDSADAALVADSNFAPDASQPLNIAVVGQVQRPGPYLVTPQTRTGEAGKPGEPSGGAAAGPARSGAGAVGGRTTVTRAIEIAGGITQSANVRQIQVRRSTRSGPQQTINVDLYKLLQEGDLKQDVILSQGDTVFIPTATNVTAAEATKLASASYSPNTIKVNVVGEVKQPGTVQVQPNTPLNQALLQAGGFNNSRARKGRVDLVRLNPDGTVSKRQVPVDLASGIDEKTNPILRNNDVVVVNRSGLARVGDSFGAFFGPLGGVFSILNLVGF